MTTLGGNSCVKCGRLIKSTVRTHLTDKPSARIICEECWCKRKGGGTA